MRWKKKYSRIVKKFALFPVKIDDEYRWLETVYVEQGWHHWYGWRDNKFINEEEYTKRVGEKEKKKQYYEILNPCPKCGSVHITVVHCKTLCFTTKFKIECYECGFNINGKIKSRVMRRWGYHE